MRWSNLETDAEERARLPGYRDDAVVRHFKAPDAIPTRFYEVRAKSILNRVPEASRMPFRWTINPFRGCTHACSYCMSGETAVLMANGRTRQLRDVQIGDPICGTRLDGGHRRFTTTTVVDKWSSIKRAFAVTLEDGTRLITSADHRFLTERGWKHVIGADRGRLQRPHLTIGIKLIGTGGATAPPVLDADYRRGYLCGMIRQDGYRRRWVDARRDARRYTAHEFRLALTDEEALARTRAFLEGFGVLAHRGAHRAAVGHRRAVSPIGNATRCGFEQVAELVDWPSSVSQSWQKGFLAGMFDAEGSWSHGNLVVSNGDSWLLAHVGVCLDELGFDHTVVKQRGKAKDGAAHVRVNGGIPQHMRLLLTVDPAIVHKRSLVGRRLLTTGQLRVKSIEPLGIVMRMYDITTGTGDFIANGVVSHNCFARPTHTYLEFDAGRDFEREIVVKVNAPERLRVELAKPSWKGEHVALGTNTDPYQWVEGRYKLMRGIWEAMIAARNPASVLTKSPLLLRDLDLMRRLNEVTDFGAALSVPTIDERAWRESEPHTPNPRARLEAVAELTRAGIRTGVLVAPLMPGINDSPEQVQEILELAEAAGAAYVSGIALHLRGEVRKVFMDWLRRCRPDLVPRYSELYRRGAYAPAHERRRLARLVSGPEPSPFERGRGAYLARSQVSSGSSQAPEPEPPPAPTAQGTLFDVSGR